MSVTFDLVKRYPWLPSLEKYYSNIASKDPFEFINEIFTSDKFQNLKEKILTLFNTAFENVEQLSEYDADETNIYMYLVSRILLYILDNKIISHRVANLYSKTIYNELNKEIDYNLYNIYRDLNLEVVYEEKPITFKKNVFKEQKESVETNFKIHFIDYLKLASHLKDEYRKLVNNALLNGFVYLQPKNLNRLIQEHVRMKLFSQNDKNPEKIKEFKLKLFKVQEFKDLFEQIKDLWDTKKVEFDYTFDIKFKEDQDLSEVLPPCVKEIFSKAKDGQNLIHTERLFMVWFLNALDYPEDMIVDVFSTLPDFDRQKTAYQVKYAKQKGYIPYSCQSLKSNSLCLAIKYKDDICINGYYSKTQEKQRKISHPLAYVRIKQYRLSRKIQNTKNQSSK